MKTRPLCIAAIVYIIGILIGQYVKISIALFFIISYLIILLLRIILDKKKEVEKKKIRNKLIKNIIMCLILAIGITYIKGIDKCYETFYKSASTQGNLKIEAIVISEVQEKEYSSTCKIEILKINGNKDNQGKKLILNIKNSNMTTIEQGNIIELTGKFKIPDKSRNDKGFDYQKYLKTQRIYGTVQTTETVKVIGKEKNKIRNCIWNIQNSLKQNIRKILPEKTANLCIGILIGDKENLEEEVVKDFKDSNLTHMLAVSGAHMTYVMLGLIIILKKLGNKTFKIIAIIFLVFFMALSNFTPSVVRAGIMTITGLIASLLYRKTDIYCNLGLAAMIILMMNPYTILDIGFQLSYAGTIGIILLSENLVKYIDEKRTCKTKVMKYIKDAIIVTVSANIIILPIMAYQFHTISITFWISNILASPLMGIAVIGGFLIYIISIISMPIAKVIAIPLNITLNILMKIAQVCSEIPFSSILVKRPYVYSTCLYYLSIIAVLNKERFKIYAELIRKKIKLVVIIITVGIFLFNVSMVKRYYNPLKIYFIDVGQGDSTLIITPSDKKILVDGGGSESFDVGEKVLVPYLLNRRIKTLDYMIISHFDTDHVSGILTILESDIKVKNIIIARQAEISNNFKELLKIVKKRKTNIIIVQAGDKIEIDKQCYFTILFPTKDLIQENALNNNSIVTKFCMKNKMEQTIFSILFTGDIEQVAENTIVELYKNTDVLKSTILKIAHHGSKSSSIEEIIKQIKPKIALIGVRRK